MFFEEGSLFLAPMEGVTDDIYRYSVEKAFGGWDYYACDFLRLPAAGKYTKKHILKHYGKRTYETDYLREKTYYQVLASQKSDIETTIATINELDFDWLDINLGCPSKTVCKNKGGSFLLSDLKLLEEVVTRLRKAFPNRLTTKIRLGYHDDSQFLDILSCLEQSGSEMITIHGRTRDQLYKGRANWEPIKKAVEHTSLPIVGNGDIWTRQDLIDIFDQTNCHGAMLARGAMKAPWFANEFKSKKYKPIHENIHHFLNTFIDQMKMHDLDQTVILKRLKNLTRYMYDDLDGGESLKISLLRSLSFKEYYQNWTRYYESVLD